MTAAVYKTATRALNINGAKQIAGATEGFGGSSDQSQARATNHTEYNNPSVNNHHMDTDKQFHVNHEVGHRSKPRVNDPFGMARRNTDTMADVVEF